MRPAGCGVDPVRLLEAHLAPYAVPFVAPFKGQGRGWSTRHGWVLQLQVAGHLGFGECAPLPGFSGENLAAAERDIRRLVRALALRELPLEPQAIAQWMTAIDAVPSARMAVETALLDLAARIKGVPLHQLLRPGSPGQVAVNATLGANGELEQSVAAAVALRDQGYGCIKVKVGRGSVARDIERVAAIRHAVGEAMTLRLDANGAWSHEQAQVALCAFEACGVSLVEQPVADLVGFRPTSSVRIAADEGVRTKNDAVRHVPWMDVCVLKPMLLGGVLAALEIEQVLAQGGIPVVYTTLLDGVIATAAVAHLACASEHLDGACGLATGPLLVADLSTTTLGISAGILSVPATPGLGVVPDLTQGYQTLWSTRATWLPHPLAHRARYLPEQVALTGIQGEKMTWARLYALAREAGRLLTQCLGEAPIRVAMYAHNQPESVAWIHAVGLLQGHLVAIHPRTPQALAAKQIEEAGAQVVLTQQAVWQGAGEAAGELPVIWIDQVSLGDGELFGGEEDYPEVAEHDLAALLYTSGTTGSPKQVPLRWGQVARSVTGSAIALGHEPSDVWLLSLPLCHVGGLSVVWRCAWLGTAVHVLGAFDAGEVAQVLVSGAVTQWSAVSRMMSQVADALGARTVHPTFRVALLGGGPVPASLITRCAAHGIKVAVTYGMTEAASQVATTPPGALTEEAGWPLVWGWVRVSEAGEIQLRGGTLMSGYVGHEQVAGWFGTGDMGQWTPQGLQMLDRRTDLIVTGGENVYPARVEAVIREHPEVEEVCVVGVESEEWGQSVVAVLEGRALAAIVPEIQAFVRGKLASFELPRGWIVQEELARSALGKVSRRRVKESLSAHMHQNTEGGHNAPSNLFIKESET